MFGQPGRADAANAEEAQAPKASPPRTSRAELYEEIAQASKLTPVYVIMIALSTVVAPLGLIRGDAAIIIGAMVIAPLPGPNVALSLASTLGDLDLARRSLTAIGVGLAFVGGFLVVYHERVAKAIERFLEEFSQRAQEFYGDRLVSLALFGSHAAGRATRRSDFDLLIILARAAPRRRQRLDEFDELEARLEPALQALERNGRSRDLSPIIRTREEAKRFSILYLDMTVHVRILFDRDAFLERRLARMRAELDRLGAERRRFGRHWYWVLKKDYRPGEVFEIS